MKKFPIAFKEKEELLAWCRDNLSLKEKRKIQSNQAENLKLRAIPVFVFDTTGRTVGEFPSIRATANELDVSVGRVTAAIKNKSKLFGMFYISDSAALEMS